MCSVYGGFHLINILIIRLQLIELLICQLTVKTVIEWYSSVIICVLDMSKFIDLKTGMQVNFM